MNLFKYTPKMGLNFGDELGPVLIKKILKTKKILNKTDTKRIFSIGSNLHFSMPGDIIWGSGINGKDRFPYRKIANDFRAVRGPLTREFLIKKGYTVPEVYGDPAILLADFINFIKLDFCNNKILIIPNYNDFEYINLQLNNINSNSNYILVHPFTNYYILISMINSCKAVVTSSLHGLICSDVFQKPNSLLLGKNYKEDKFKYLDYSHSINKKFSYHENLKDGLKKLCDPTLIPESMKKTLLSVFPYDMFNQNSFKLENSYVKTEITLQSKLISLLKNYLAKIFIKN